MADTQHLISHITLPSGTTYEIKDAVARDLIDSMSGYTDFLGVTTTALTNDATTNPIKINGENVTATKGCIVTYGSKEFIFNGSKWAEFGDLSALKALAYKESVSVSYQKATSITGTHSFQGASMTSTGNYTPEGGISTGTGTANYTPDGTVSTPTITVALNTASKYVASSATGGGSVTPGTAAQCTLPSLSATVQNENLTLSWTAGSFTANSPTGVTLPSFSSQTIATSVKSATSSQPTFTGDGVELKFTGTQKQVSVSGTTKGSISGTLGLGYTDTAGTVTYSPS